MGDPLHARPATVIYGGTAAAPDLDDDALYVVTNDGVLHAIDPTRPNDESQGGREYWAFVPRELVGRLRDLYYNRALADPEDRGYGLDAGITVLKLDHDDDGIVEPADEPGARDRVFLYFGERRGGSSYFAFDVTRKLAPLPLWTRSYAPEGAGQSWSTPGPARVRIGAGERLVLVFGGGYDTTQDEQPYAEDSRGRGVYMVDAVTGELLWRAGPDEGATLQLAGMRHSIPGDVRVIDLSGDGLADRLYAADLGGRVWRFDIANGRPVAGPEGERLVEGGLVASLGNAEDTDSRDQAATRRFFHAPDPALITREGTSFVNIAVGSGHRERPASDLTTQDWFFAVRDYNAYTPLLASSYRDDCSSVATACHEIVWEEDLVDLTDVVGPDATAAVPATTAGRAAGWRLRLARQGEKALAESRTFQGKVFFTTHSPIEADPPRESCSLGGGVNRLYIVNAVDARPVHKNDESATESMESPDDRSRRLAQGGIAPEAVFVFPAPGADPEHPDPPRPRAPPVCLVGLEHCGVGLSNSPERTYWRQRGTR
jgi:type IV pilus assembly protein PilY1